MKTRWQRLVGSSVFIPNPTGLELLSSVVDGAADARLNFAAAASKVTRVRLLRVRGGRAHMGFREHVDTISN